MQGARGTRGRRVDAARSARSSETPTSAGWSSRAAGSTHRQLVVFRRPRGLCVRPGRRGRSRRRQRDADAAGRDRLARSSRGSPTDTAAKLVMIVTDVDPGRADGRSPRSSSQRGPAAHRLRRRRSCRTVVGVAFRPAQAALLPRLARDPAELTAANVASSTLEAVGDVRRTGARRHPPRAHEHRDRLRRQRPVVRLVGVARARGAGWRGNASREGGRRPRPRRRRRAGEGIRALVANRRPSRPDGPVHGADPCRGGAQRARGGRLRFELLDVGSAGVGASNAALGSRRPRRRLRRSRPRDARPPRRRFRARDRAVRHPVGLDGDHVVGGRSRCSRSAFVGLGNSIVDINALDDHAADRPGRGAGPGARRARGGPDRLDRASGACSRRC